MLLSKNGDRNTVFFHVVVKRRNNSSGIHLLLIDNEIIEDPKLIEDHILGFYKNLYAETIFNDRDTSSTKKFISTYILELVSFEDNTMLIKCLDSLEIKNEVFNLNGNSAPGLDDFSCFFFHSCWDIIGTDVCKAVQQFFKQNWVLYGMNTMWYLLFLRFRVLAPLKITSQLLLISNLRLFPKYWRIDSQL